MEKKDTIIVNMFRDAPWPGNTLSNLDNRGQDNRGQRAINSNIRNNCSSTPITSVFSFSLSMTFSIIKITRQFKGTL
jgi:hypothetical protein